MATIDYSLADGTAVRVEFEPGSHFRPRMAGDRHSDLGREVDALVSGAMMVVQGARHAGVAGASVKFGIKVDSEARLMIAKEPSHAQFEVQLTWSARSDPSPSRAGVGAAGRPVSDSAPARVSATGSLPPTPDFVGPAVEALKAGWPIGIPTDTVYGLAVDPSVPGATDRLFAAKRRPRDVTLPVLVADPGQALALASGVSDRARLLMDKFWPGPLTIVVVRRDGLELDLGDEVHTVGIRCPDHAVPRALAARVGPLATTSANLHGQPPATTAEEVAATFGRSIAAVLDGGRCAASASTVVDCTGEEVRLLRSGSLAWEEVVAVAG